MVRAIAVNADAVFVTRTLMALPVAIMGFERRQGQCRVRRAASGGSTLLGTDDFALYDATGTLCLTVCPHGAHD